MTSQLARTITIPQKEESKQIFHNYEQTYGDAKANAERLKRKGIKVISIQESKNCTDWVIKYWGAKE